MGEPTRLESADSAECGSLSEVTTDATTWGVLCSSAADGTTVSHSVWCWRQMIKTGTSLSDVLLFCSQREGRPRLRASRGE